MNPVAAGIKASLPISCDISMAGISSDHIDAATITPEAKPNISFLGLLPISCFIKKTVAAPSAVPKNGIVSPCI